MSIIDIEFIHCYVKLQSELISATRAAYPNAKDMKWMLDFPKSGIIEIDDYQWSFIKHGSGLKFIRQKVSPFITVDIHKYFDEPKAFDSWRLVEFLNSFWRECK